MDAACVRQDMTGMTPAISCYYKDIAHFTRAACHTGMTHKRPLYDRYYRINCCYCYTL